MNPIVSPPWRAFPTKQKEVLTAAHVESTEIVVLTLLIWQDSAEVLGRILCVFGWLLALLRVLLTVIPCMARRGAENETAEPFRTEPSAEPSAEPRTEPRTTRSEGEQEQPREARTVSTPSGLCPDVPRYDPESGQR
eukprot:s419_g12.t1